MTSVCYTGQPNRDISLSNLLLDNGYIRQNLTVNGTFRTRKICVQIPDPVPASRQIVYFNSAANVTNNNFLQPNGQTATETQAQQLMPTSGTLTKLYINLVNAPSGIATRTFTVRLNGNSTSLAVTISGSATTGNNSTDTISFVAGDLVSIQHVETNAPIGSVARASFIMNVS